MKIDFKMNYGKILRQLMWGVLVFAFLLSVGFTESKRKELLCTGLSIRIVDTTGNSFVEVGEVERMLLDKFGTPVGKPMSNINMALLEKIVKNNAFVATAEVFSTADGMLSIEVEQRNPVMRVINYNGESFYIDDLGVFMPLSEKYSANVAVANGIITSTFADKKIRVFSQEELADTSIHLSMLERLFVLNSYVSHHEFWNSQIEQYYINTDLDIELVPRVGDHVILLGNEQDMEKKFDKLFHFYTEGLNRTGWNQYKTINLKYDGQVVCTKN